WLAEREAELLPVPYFHVVFTLPGPVTDIAYQNKAVIYDLLFKAAAEATLTIAADPKHLGANIGITAVLHTWGSALTHHPHLHKVEWVVYAKEPFGGPQAVLAYLSRYTHRVAISNRRLISADEGGVTFKWKDYRIEGPGRYKTMTLPTYEFIRRFLMHVLPKGVHRIRHYGLFANGNRAANIARARQLLAAPAHVTELKSDAPVDTEQLRMLPTPCPCCGGRMIIIESFARGQEP